MKSVKEIPPYFKRLKKLIKRGVYEILDVDILNGNEYEYIDMIVAYKDNENLSYVAYTSKINKKTKSEATAKYFILSKSNILAAAEKMIKKN